MCIHAVGLQHVRMGESARESEGESSAYSMCDALQLEGLRETRELQLRDTRENLQHVRMRARAGRYLGAERE